jgi:hypothetical protein
MEGANNQIIFYIFIKITTKEYNKTIRTTEYTKINKARIAKKKKISVCYTDTVTLINNIILMFDYEKIT